MTVRFGILGAGNIARKLAAAVGACEEAELAAVAARDLSRAEAFCRENGGRKAYGSYDELLNDPEIDAVYIALPNKLHLPYAIQAMEHGKAVLSEKPFAATRAEAAEGVEAARRTGALFMEAMWTRWLPPVQQAKRWLDEGRIGKPLLADLAFTFAGEATRRDPRYHPELDGGSLMDVGCYCLSTIQYFAGERPAKVCGVLKTGALGVDEVGTGSLLFPSGLVASIGFGMQVRSNGDFWIYGEKGKILLREFWGCRDARCYDADGNEMDRCTDEETNGFVYEVRELCRLLREGKKESPFMTWQDTIDVAESIERLRASFTA